MAQDTLPPDWCPPSEFRRQLPTLHRSMESLRWELRHRHDNGLVADGVVIERYTHPTANRPSLLISPTRYLDRLKRLSRGAA